MFGHAEIRRLGALCTVLAASVLLLAGCEENAPTALDVEAATPGEPTFSPGGAPGQLDPAVRGQLEELRQSTARYHDIEAAEADGWDVRFPPECLTHAELGGMGYHLLNQDLLDGQITVEQPEFMVYEPGPGGQMKLVSVEYVIPFDVRPADGEPPTLFGREFHPNETYGVWAFHVWIWRHNPRGIFEDWNPMVSCEHAEDVRTFPEE